jgi:L-rhamnose isomerase
MLKALLIALLEPVTMLREIELADNYTARLAMLEELKTMPYGAVWDYYCTKMEVPPAQTWLDEVKDYEKDVLAKRR